jgi:hypothetical protein
MSERAFVIGFLMVFAAGVCLGIMLGLLISLVFERWSISAAGWIMRRFAPKPEPCGLVDVRSYIPGVGFYACHLPLGHEGDCALKPAPTEITTEATR